MHSKPKLALAVMTSPGAAFEEIIQRKLLGTGLFIAALTGVLSMVAPLADGFGKNHLELFLIGKQNPLCWMGLFLLYGFILHKLLNWLGTKNEYKDVLTIMGWSQVLLLLVQVIAVGTLIASAAGANALMLKQVSDTTKMALPLFYVIVIGAGLQSAYRIPLMRGALSYFVVSAMAGIAMSLTYVSSRMQIFQQALPGINWIARLVVNTDMISWFGVGVIGLVLGLWMLGQQLGWDKGARTRAAACAGLVGILAFGLYVQWMSRMDYYGALMNAQRLYDLDKFEAAAKQMEGLIAIPGEPMDSALLQLDIADTYQLAGKSRESIDFYQRCLKLIATVSASDTKNGRALIHSRMGTVYDSDGRYELAIGEFEKATKAWPQFRDPWNRKAITYNRMGEYKKAIDAAKTSVDKLGSKTAVPWVALAQAFLQTHDTKQAGVAMTMVTEKDAELAKKIGAKPEDWKNAVNKLTRADLRYPMEKEDAPPPPKETKKGGK